MASRKKAAPPPESAAPGGKKSSFREFAEAIAIAFVLAMFIRGFIVQAFKIPSGSMEDTLLVGDHLLVTKYDYSLDMSLQVPFTGLLLFKDARFLQKAPARGDVIVFRFPRDESKDYIKRVIGLPGEEIKIRQRKVYIDGKPIDEPYAFHKEPPASQPVPLQDELGPLRIPEGQIFVMGDNREHSHDSRFWGFLDLKNIKGKARVIYWSWDNDHSRVRIDRLAHFIH